MDGIIEKLKGLRTIDNVDEIERMCNMFEFMLKNMKTALNEGKTPVGYVIQRAALMATYELLEGGQYKEDENE